MQNGFISIISKSLSRKDMNLSNTVVNHFIFVNVGANASGDQFGHNKMMQKINNDWPGKWVLIWEYSNEYQDDRV